MGHTDKRRDVAFNAAEEIFIDTFITLREDIASPKRRLYAWRNVMSSNNIVERKELFHRYFVFKDDFKHHTLIGL